MGAPAARLDLRGVARGEPRGCTLRSICQRAGITLHEGEAAPPTPAQPAPPRGAFALAPGDLITLDDARVVVGGSTTRLRVVQPDAKGFLTGTVERCLWREVEHLGESRWRILPVDTETPSAKAKGKAAKPKRTPKKPRAGRCGVMFDGELVVDNFAGGGASTGIEAAIGRPVDIAINHSPEAIAMHAANHPRTKHYCENI